MIGYYCLNCGGKLKQLSMNPSWYKVRHIIVEWVEEKKEGEGEHDG